MIVRSYHVEKWAKAMPQLFAEYACLKPTQAVSVFWRGLYPMHDVEGDHALQMCRVCAEEIY